MPGDALLRMEQTTAGEQSTPGRDNVRSSFIRTLSAWRYAAVVLVIGAISLVAPIPSGAVRQASLAAARSSSGIVILGPSVVRHTSVCDSDHRNLAEMLAASSERSVNDLSYPGQPLMEAVHLAALEA